MDRLCIDYYHVFGNETELKPRSKKSLSLLVRYCSNTFPYVIPIISDVILNDLNVTYRAYTMLIKALQ